MRAAQFLAIIGRGSKGSNALELTEDRAGATSEQQDNVINTVNSLDPYGPSWHLDPGNVAAGTVYAQVPTSGTGDLTFSRASTATRTNSAGNIVDVASGVGRIHYRNADGSLSSTGRLLLEPQRTNSIRNSSAVGAVAGSPGTLPTNWVSANGGLTQTIVGTGTENGLQYIDLRFNGTANATIVQLRYDAANQIAASNGQAWSYTVYLKAISQPAPPINYTQLMFERTAVGTLIKSAFQVIVPTSNLQRFTFTRTLDGGATVAFVDPVLYLNITSGQAYDFTIRIAAPQMDLGAYATTFIKTSTAAVTRVRPTVSKTGVSSLIGQTEGTIYWEGFLGANTQTVFSVRASNAQNSCVIDIIENNRIRAYVVTNNVQRFQLDSDVMTLGANIKIAFAYKSGQSVLYVNSVPVTSSTAFTFAEGLQALFADWNGYNYGTGQAGTKAIAQAALFPTRLTNAQLAEITTL
jgi:hypothetical protein